jgi:hypothetical protein
MKQGDVLCSIPEVLILDKDNSPIVDVDLVSERPFCLGGKLEYLVLLSELTFSLPKPHRTVAECMFAISVGYVDESLPPAEIAAPPADLTPSQATAIAIDDHHLLTCAHVFDYDTALRKYPSDKLKYKYAAPAKLD